MRLSVNANLDFCNFAQKKRPGLEPEGPDQSPSVIPKRLRARVNWHDFNTVNEADKGILCKHRLCIYALAFPRTIILPYPWKVPIIVSAIPPKHGFSARLQILLSMVMRKLAMRFSDWLRPLFRECILPLIQS